MAWFFGTTERLAHLFRESDRRKPQTNVGLPRKYSELGGAWCGLFRVTGLSRYWGLLGARNCELIQPFKPVFSTCTQSPSRLVAVNRVPLGAEPRTGAFPEGADLMFTPGRCKKTKSRFCAAEGVWGVTALGATWGEASVTEAGGTTPDAARDGSGTVTVGAGCTGVSDDVCAAIGEDSVVSAGTFAPGEARKKYVSPATPNAARIAVPAISFRRAPNVSDGFVSYRLFGSRGSKGASGSKESSPPATGRKVSSRRRSRPAAFVPFGARGGAQTSSGGFSLPSAKPFPPGRTSVISTVAMLPPIPHQRFSALPHRRTAALQHRPSRIGRKDGDRTTAERHSNGLLMTSFSSLGEYLRSGSIRRFKPDKAGHDPYRHHWTQRHLIVGWPIALLACACVALSSLPARAEQSCAPKTNAAKILRTKNVNDVDPNWAPPAFIGTSWSLIETRQEGEFLTGVLVNPRGGVLPGRVFVIANEWDFG